MSNEISSPIDPANELEVRDKQAVEREATRPGPVFQPDVDILENGDAFLIHADLPGADENSVQVRLDDGVLSLDARLATLPGESWTPIHSEYRFGGYHREFRLPDEVDEDAVQASMRDGVLKLTLPKAEIHQRRQIEVRAG
ncbi:MAG: Hsp20/alpha crystallin family protein [Myxococcota bacterium]